MTNIFSSLNLSHNPFTLATSREGFYQTESTRRILDELAHGIETRKGFMVLIGEVGVGKTSLSLQLFSSLEEKKVAFAWVFNTVFTKEELFRAIVDDFGLACERDFSLLEYQKLLHQFFLRQYEAGQTCVIVVDEAHNLSNDSLESLRMLTNFESGGQKLVQVVLIGQPELGVRLSQEQLRQLRSRVAIYLTLPHLDREELAGYVNYKLAEAGSQLRLDGKAARMLWDATRGNLRQSKLVMERALYGCVAFGVQELNLKVMKSAVQDVQTACNTTMAPVQKTGKRWGFLAGMGAACLVLFGLAFVPFWSVAGKTVSARDVVMGKIVPASETENVEDVLSRWPRLSSDAELGRFGSSLNGFLQKDLLRELLQAVAIKAPEVLERRLPADVMMLRLEHLPVESGTNDSWLAFAWRRYSNTGPTWLVFWRPGMAVEEPAPGEKSAAVFDLQQSLQQRGVLSGGLDGVMGTKTWYALARFQRETGLTVTGTADAETQFFLKFL